MDDLELPTEEQMQAIKEEINKMIQKETRQREFEQLQDKLTPHIEHIVLKFLTYFSQYFRAKEYKPFDPRGLVTINTQQEIVSKKIFDQFSIKDGTASQLLLANGETSDIGDFLPKNYPHAFGQMIIEPNDDIRNQGLRLMKNKANWDSFVLTGCNVDPENRDGVWKIGSTSSQFRIQKQEDQAYDIKGLVIDFDCTSLKFNNQLISPIPIEYATQQTLAIGVFDFFTWGKATLLNKRVYISIGITHSNPNTNTNYGYTIFSFMYDIAKSKFSGSSYNIPLNAIMYITKQSTTPVVWLNPIPIDCFIDPDGHVKINSQCQYNLPNDFFVQVCDSYALYNQ